MNKRNLLTVCALEMPPLALADLPVDVFKDLDNIFRRSLRINELQGTYCARTISHIDILHVYEKASCFHGGRK